jgi:hypothetical protein
MGMVAKRLVRSLSKKYVELTCNSTVTTTVTVTAGEPLKLKRGNNLEVRQATVVPSAIPTYASACSSAAAYASACSCFGVTGSVSTAPTPTSTVTVTTTVDYCEEVSLLHLEILERDNETDMGGLF